MEWQEPTRAAIEACVSAETELHQRGMPSSRAQALAMKIAAAAGDGAGAGAPPVPEPAAPNSWFADHATFQDEARALVDALPGAPEFSCVDPQN